MKAIKIILITGSLLWSNNVCNSPWTGSQSSARRMVFGGYFTFGGMKRPDLRLVEVEIGSILKAAQKATAAGDLNGWLKAAGQAAAELI